MRREELAKAIRRLSICRYDRPLDQCKWQRDVNRSDNMLATVNSQANWAMCVVLRISRQVTMG